MKPHDVALLKRITSHRAFLPVAVFAALVVVLVVMTNITNRPPVIETITPQVGYPGTIMTITGANFGGSRGTSEIIIAGIRPTTSAYLEWTNKRISVRVPSDVQSGMVYIKRNTGRSNGKLFTNRNNIPVLVKTTTAPGQPHITSLSPGSGAAGTKLTITGENFGNSRGTGNVYFTPVSVADQGVQASDIGAKERFTSCGCDYTYESWSDKQIVLYVPDGASSGNITVVTDRGTSNSQYFEVANQIGTKSYNNKRGYQIHYGVQVSDVTSGAGGTVDLWLPNLSNTLSQRHIERIVEPKPMWGDYKGLMRIQLGDLKPNANYPTSVTYYFDRYAVETRIDPTKVADNYDTARQLYKAYTGANALVPAADPTVVSTAAQVVGAQRNPYREARLLYDFVTQKLKYSASASSDGPVAALKAGTGDSYSLALIYAALLRAAKIPARPVAGVLVYGDKKTVDHYWTEFYIHGFGWVPTDPALGAGAKFGGFPTRADAANYYFGNLDNQHITFTQGLVTVDQLSPSGKSTEKTRTYSLQTAAEEASTSVKSYTATWDDVRVVDWW